jgi:hypothetical protein
MPNKEITKLTTKTSKHTACAGISTDTKNDLASA